MRVAEKREKDNFTRLGEQHNLTARGFGLSSPSSCTGETRTHEFHLGTSASSWRTNHSVGSSADSAGQSSFPRRLLAPIIRLFWNAADVLAGGIWRRGEAVNRVVSALALIRSLQEAL